MLHAANLVRTYSIVAIDRRREEMGCTVQPRFFAVGVLRLRAEPRIGVVATQAMVVVSTGTGGDFHTRHHVNLRVEDQPQPLLELSACGACGKPATTSIAEMRPWNRQP